MTVFVDHVLPCIPNKRWRYRRSAHLVAHDLSELHEFAGRLGLKPSWFQRHDRLPHYDITEAKWKRAIHMGAELITREEFVKLMKPLAPAPE